MPKHNGPMQSYITFESIPFKVNCSFCLWKTFIN